MSNHRVGTWIRDSRQARGWNQTQVGTMAGVSQVRVSQWERGQVSLVEKPILDTLTWQHGYRVIYP